MHGFNNDIDTKAFVPLKSTYGSGNSLPVSKHYFVGYIIGAVKNIMQMDLENFFRSVPIENMKTDHSIISHNLHSPH
jgi:hypothetical protein